MSSRHGGLSKGLSFAEPIQRFQSCFPGGLNTRLRASFAQCGNGRQFAVALKGDLAMVPPRTEVVDEVCIFEGAQTPLLVMSDNKISVDGESIEYQAWQLVEQYYVHSMMDGATLERIALV
ncbi:hypothetical protein AOQ84DRAFT_418964 [Glonium stellatum]|uniref:Uncharacterized protein n=1 Tax=Glonium stellatum TaxID=574774 RepID=A0A8E2F916_9PEZI|nr:hypothetical protein AOQ84DRAFT_418964 [Glonium stellatum]